VRCAACGRRSHLDGHLRRFDDAAIEELFGSRARLERRMLAGVLQPRHSRVGAALWRLSGGSSPVDFRCPHCGAREASTPGWAREALSPLTIRASHVLRWPRRPLPYWALALYRKVDG
jgi:hypothetical protein